LHFTKPSSYHKGPPTSKKMHFILVAELIRGLKSSEFGCTERSKIGHGTCSVKLNTFLSCSNILVHSSKESYRIDTSVVLATSKWHLELCTDNYSMHDVQDKNLSQLTDHPDRNS
jgi:hypothetical protein